MKIPYDKLDIILETSKELIKEKEKQRKINERMLFLIDISSFATGICIFVFFCSKRAVYKRKNMKQDTLEGRASFYYCHAYKAESICGDCQSDDKTSGRFAGS